MMALAENLRHVEPRSKPFRPIADPAQLVSIMRNEHCGLAEQFCPAELEGAERRAWINGRVDRFVLRSLVERLANAREQVAAHQAGQQRAHEKLAQQRKQVERAELVEMSSPTARNSGNVARQRRLEAARADEVARWGAAALAWGSTVAQLQELISECEQKGAT